MRALSAFALILSLIAIVLAGMSLAKPPPPRPDDQRAPQAPPPPANDARIIAAEDRAAALEKRVASLAADVARLTAAKAEAPVAASSGAPAVAGDAAGDDHIKAVVQAELQAQMQKMRAQWGGGGGQGGPPPIDANAIKQQLGVDDTKAEQLSKLANDLRATTRDIFRQNKGGDRDGNMKLMAEERTKAEAKAAEILSPEEMTKLKALLDQQRGPGGRRGGPQDPPPPGAPGDGAPPAPAPTPAGTGF